MTEEHYADAENRLRRYAITSIENKQVRRMAFDVIDACNWSAKSPDAILAAAEYTSRLLVNKDATQKELAEKYGVSTGIIRKRYDDMVECWHSARAAGEV